MKTVSRINDIFVTECISFPRSGHHLLTSLLQEFFGGQLVFHSVYENTGTQPIGEHGSVTNYQKNHDFDLTTLVREDRNYVVQLRNPIDSLASWRELDLRTGALFKADPADRAVWRDESKSRLEYFTGFTTKWLFSYVPNRLVVFYEDLVGRPEEVLTSVVQHLRGKQDVNFARIRDVVKQINPAPRQKTRPAFYTAA